MPKNSSDTEPNAEAVPQEVIETIVDRAKEEGVSEETAKEIINDAVSEGVAPDKLEEVAEDAIRVEREDREESGA